MKALCFLGAQLFALQALSIHGADWAGRGRFTGGGGPAVSGRFTLSGAVLHSPAVKAASGHYRLQTVPPDGPPRPTDPSPPELRVLLDGESIVLSWPAAAPSYILEESSAVTDSSWSATPGTAQVVSGRLTLVVDRSAASRYFRLRWEGTR